jgi:hypothetical protein
MAMTPDNLAIASSSRHQLEHDCGSDAWWTGTTVAQEGLVVGAFVILEVTR